MKRRSKRKHLDEEALVRAALSLYPGKPRCCGPCGHLSEFNSLLLAVGSGATEKIKARGHRHTRGMSRF